MPIDNQYAKYYEIVNLYIQPEDIAMTDDKDKLVYVSLDHDMVYLDHNQNKQAFPMKIKGTEWTALWWMYRLSERKCRFQDYLAEHIIPVCRRYFIEEKRRLPPRDENDSDRGPETSG